MANVRASDLEFIGGWCSQPLAAEFKRLLKKKRLGVSETLERMVEAFVQQSYAEIGKPFPVGVEKALSERRERKLTAKWVAKPKVK
jgi:hypothetical protein